MTDNVPQPTPPAEVPRRAVGWTIWIATCLFAILIGAELNAEIEHASPAGKNPGEKVQGEKRHLGSFVREWVARRQRRGEKPPSAGEVRELLDKTGGGPNDTTRLHDDPRSEL